MASGLYGGLLVVPCSLLFYEVCVDMSFDVMNTEERLVPDVGERLCGRDTDLKRWGKSGSFGYGDGF